MQGPSTYLPALLSSNIQILYGGGTAVSRTIAGGDAPIVVIGSETRYVPERLMVSPAIKSPADLRGKKTGVSRGGLDEYAALYYLEKNGLVSGKDVALLYATGGVQARAAQMKQGLFDAMTVSPPNEIELEKLGFRELVDFFEMRMPYAGIPYTVTKDFRDKNPRVLTDFMTVVVEAIQIFRSNKEADYKAIIHLTRQKDPLLLEKIYKANLAQYDAIQPGVLRESGTRSLVAFPSANSIGGLLVLRCALLAGPDITLHFDVSGILETWKFAHER